MSNNTSPSACLSTSFGPFPVMLSSTCVRRWATSSANKPVLTYLRWLLRHLSSISTYKYPLRIGLLGSPRSLQAKSMPTPSLQLMLSFHPWTLRHEEILYSWRSEHNPLMLCGPPGSGKTMMLFSALCRLPDMEVVGLNFSSAIAPELILRTFEQYCEYRKTPNGVILAPVQIGRWLVVFCDEINLPAQDIRHSTSYPILPPVG
jgi:hypothetical protein